MPAEFWKAGCCTTSVGHCNCFIELPGKPSVPFFLKATVADFRGKVAGN